MRGSLFSHKALVITQRPCTKLRLNHRIEELRGRVRVLAELMGAHRMHSTARYSYIDWIVGDYAAQTNTV